MTTEQYLKAVARNLKCSKIKREEIKKQLQSDLEVAVEEGKTPEQALGLMGNAKDVADEFNRNFTDIERKAYKKSKRRKFLCVSLLIVLFAAYAIYWFVPKGGEIGKSGFFEQQALEEQVQFVIATLDDNDLDTLKSHATETMQQALTLQTIDTVKKNIGENWGERQTIGHIYLGEITQMGKTMAVAQVTVTYEQISVTYTLSFESDGKLAGLYMK